jgi:hypothetical protein
LLKMTSLENSNKKNFFLGLLTIILDLKVSLYESEEDRLNEVRKSLEIAAKHLTIIKDMSIITYFDFILFRAALNFQTKVDISHFEDLLHSFKFFRTYRKFRKR